MGLWAARLAVVGFGGPCAALYLCAPGFADPPNPTTGYSLIAMSLEERISERPPYSRYYFHVTESLGSHAFSYDAGT